MRLGINFRQACRFVLAGVVSLGVVQSVQSEVSAAVNVTISGISPSSGPSSGGTIVTITGTKMTETSSVTFGGVAGTSITNVNPSRVTVVTPAHAAGDVDVVVTSSDGSVSSADGFTYIAATTSTIAATTSTTATDSVPVAPTSLSGTAGNASVLLTWTAPTLPPSAINDYIIQFSSNGTTWTTFADGVSTVTSATVTGLTNGTPYTFRVSVVRSAGPSATWVVSDPVTPQTTPPIATTVPQPPIAVPPTAVPQPPNAAPPTTSTTTTLPVPPTTEPSTTTTTTTIPQPVPATTTTIPTPRTTPTTTTTIAPLFNAPTVITASDGATIMQMSIPQTTGSTDAAPNMVAVVVPPAANTENLVWQMLMSDRVQQSTIDDGYITVDVTANTRSGDSVTQLDAPIEIRLPVLPPQDSVLAYTRDDITWTLIPQLLVPTLPEGQEDGYFVEADGSVTVLTRHLTGFGIRKPQAPLKLSVAEVDIVSGSVSRATATGGTSEDPIRYEVMSDPSVCKVSDAGLIYGLTAGTCTVYATRGGGSIYLNTSSTTFSAMVVSSIAPRVPSVANLPLILQISALIALCVLLGILGNRAWLTISGYRYNKTK